MYQAEIGLLRVVGVTTQQVDMPHQSLGGNVTPSQIVVPQLHLALLLSVQT